jgi:CMP-N-acetylneuraminic acid synthetase
MIDNQRVVALVPIKEHSERVHGKNFRDFCGRPLYEHIVHTLHRTYAVDEIVIDTDSPRVLYEGASLSDKVRVIERPEEVRGDHTSMNRVIAHDLSQTEGDIYLQTHATNPLLTSHTIEKGLLRFVESEDGDSLFGVSKHQSRFYRADGTPMNHDPDRLIRTQDLDPVYEENSCIYVFTKESFARTGARIGKHPILFPISGMEAVDIDNELTFRLAELLTLYSLADEA